MDDYDEKDDSASLGQVERANIDVFEFGTALCEQEHHLAIVVLGDSDESLMVVSVEEDVHQQLCFLFKRTDCWPLSELAPYEAEAVLDQVDPEETWSIEEQEWYDPTNKRMALFEVWYRRWESVVVLKSPDGRVVEYDITNPAHDVAIATGAGHHSVMNIPGTDEWYIIYHRRPLSEKDGNALVTCMDRMYFDEQGFIKPVIITRKGVEKRTIR